MTSASASQFNCIVCGQGFEQKSRLQRHMDTSHPPRAPSAADLEKVFSGIKYPMFGDRRWINVEDPSLLNYENTQLLLIGARKKDVEEELGVDIDEEKESKLSSDLFKELHVRREQVPLKPIFKGDFPRKEEIPTPDEVKKLGKDEYPGRKGGKIGGKAAATKAVSAASIARLLFGIRFPKKKEEVVAYAYARKNKGKIDKSEEEKVIKTINELADRTYHTIIEVEKALGEVR